MFESWKTWSGVWQRSTRKNEITAEQIDSELVQIRPSGNQTVLDSGSEEQLQAAVSSFTRRYLESHGDETPLDNLYQTVLHEIEKPLVTLTLRALRGNQIQAAKVLGLNRNTLRKKIRELDIEVIKGLD